MFKMHFPFSFTLLTPGISNPFIGSHDKDSHPIQAPQVDKPAQVPTQELAQVRRRAPSPSLTPSVPLSRKRGWVPSSSELSLPTPMHTSTSGYLDTPAKYREMATSANDQDEFEEMVAELPPPKRRRTLAGSIVSTALSAALIGTAVGLTVYRLWRDCGKTETLPPPPYEQGQWVPPTTSEEQAVPITKVTPATPRHRRTRHVASRRTVAALPRHRKTPSRTQAFTPPRSVSPSLRASIPPEFNFAGASQEPPEEDDLDEHVSWMGDRLAQLIAEGQRALGKEIVVMSEAKEDEEDDGMDVWVEDDDAGAAGSASGSRRKSRRGSFHVQSSPYLGPSLSALSVPSTPRRGRTRGLSVGASFQEDDSAWESPELRASMERARSLHRRTRA